MSVKITGGERKGAILFTRPGEETRPLLGRVRQALFNILAPITAGARCLDLFAGSGAVGLEALSQGARSCLFVERDAAAAEVIERNIRKLRFEDRARIHRGALPGALDHLPPPAAEGEGGKPEGRYNLVFIMPPFGQALLPPTLERLATRPDRLNPGAILIGQLERGEPRPQAPIHSLRLFDERRYGVTELLFWEFVPPAPGA